MGDKSILLKYGNFVWIISLMRRVSFRIILQKILMNTSREREKMENGEMMLRSKHFHKFTIAPYKSMFLMIGLSVHSMRTTTMRSNPTG